MKIVINVCYGGFGLSQAAVKRLAMAGSPLIKVIDEKTYYGNWDRRDVRVDIGDGFKCEKFSPEVLLKDGNVFFVEREKDNRNHVDMVSIVEQMGKAASGQLAELKIVEIPNDVEWTIEEYDGTEWVAEAHRTWS